MDPKGTPKDVLLSLASSKGIEWTSREFAQVLDELDELSWFRDEFMIPKLILPDDTISEIHKIYNGSKECVYFCGHSLGLQNHRVAKNVNKVLENWQTNHIESHFTGYLPAAQCDEKIKDLMANIVGAQPSEVSIMNGLTVNLHLMMVSFYNPTPSRHKILLEAKAFPSDHYVVESQIRLRGYNPEESMLQVSFSKDYLWNMDDIIKTIEEKGDSIAVVLLPGVQYLTGQVFDMQRITQVAHSKGCMVGFDLAHAVGNIELSLHDWNVDFACWCTYKYVNSGAGGIAGAFLHNRIDTSKLDKLLGWWGHKMESRFAMDNQLDLSPGIDGYRISNPPPLLCAPLHASLVIFNSATMKRLAAKRFKLTGYLELLLKHYFSKENKSKIDIVTPASTNERGSMLCLRFATPINKIFEELQRYGCIVDKREPDIMRVTPAPLYCSFQDVYKFIHVLKTVTENL